MMAYAYQDFQQQFPFQNPQQTAWTNQQHWMNPQLAQTYGLGQAAYGQYGGQPNIGAWGAGAWSQHRQLSQNEVGDVVRQLVPLLPQILAQVQQQPQAAYGYGGFGGLSQGYGQNFGQSPRLLTQQDVNEVVRQILPILPQIVGVLQGQNPLTAAAIYGGQGAQMGPQIGSQNPLGPFANPFQQNPLQQQWFGQQGWQQPMAAYGGTQAWGQRQLTQHDVNEVVRQLAGIIPQVISGLQAYGQQRVN